MFSRRRGPETPADEIIVGSVIAQLWKRKSRFGKPYWSLSLGRWKADKRKMFVTRYVYPSDLDDVIEVCLLAKNRLGS